MGAQALAYEKRCLGNCGAMNRDSKTPSSSFKFRWFLTHQTIWLDFSDIKIMKAEYTNHHLCFEDDFKTGLRTGDSYSM